MVHALSRRRDVAGLATEVVGNDNNPSVRAEMLDEVAKISAAMTSLRPEQQQVLKLSIYDGLTQQEIFGLFQLRCPSGPIDLAA